MKPVFQKIPSRILFTRQGYQDVLDQKAKLLKERPYAVEHLHKAREMGDLSENGYYKASRARLSFIDAQLRKLERLVRLGKVVESIHSAGVIGFGSEVTIRGANGKQTYTIVGGYESDPAKHTVSHISPLGKVLIGKKNGDTITLHAPSGEMVYVIDSVS
jgi:transcription elongation factor GreA